MARRIKRPQAPSLAAPPEEAITVTADNRLNPYWGLDGRIPVETGWKPENVLRWAEKHAPDLLVSEERALRAAERDHAAKARREARSNDTKN
jgi:hypothetical protein